MGDRRQAVVERPRGIEDLEVYKVARLLVVEIYQLTRSFPKDEMYGLTAQIRRSVVSVVSNLAEGRGRMGPDEFRHHVSIARGSAAETLCQLEIAMDLGYVTHEGAAKAVDLNGQVLRMLTGLYGSLSRRDGK